MVHFCGADLWSMRVQVEEEGEDKKLNIFTHFPWYWGLLWPNRQLCLCEWIYPLLLLLSKQASLPGPAKALNSQHTPPIDLRTLSLLIRKSIHHRPQLVNWRSQQPRKTLTIQVCGRRPRVRFRRYDLLCSCEAPGDFLGFLGWNSSFEAGHVFLGFVLDVRVQIVHKLFNEGWEYRVKGREGLEGV